MGQAVKGAALNRKRGAGRVAKPRMVRIIRSIQNRAISPSAHNLFKFPFLSIKMKKRGQVYLLATLILVSVIVSLGTVYNKAKFNKEDATAFYLADEIYFEANQIIEHSIRNSVQDTDTSTRIKSLLDYYASSNPYNDLIVIYGTQQTLTAFFYDNLQVSTLEINNQQISNNPTTLLSSSNPGTIKITTQGKDINYQFTLHQGKNFLVLIKKERQGETFIAIPKGIDITHV